MIETQERTRAYLERRFPKRWLHACNEAWNLARQIEYLDWAERATILDGYLWREAQTRLTTEEITAVVNREIQSLELTNNVERYAEDCTAIMTGVLMMLRIGLDISGAEQALCLLLSEDDGQSEAAQDWIALIGNETIIERLSGLPGFAFVFLAASPSDSAASFMARDAFWTAMLGKS